MKKTEPLSFNLTATPLPEAELASLRALQTARLQGAERLDRWIRASFVVSLVIWLPVGLLWGVGGAGAWVAAFWLIGIVAEAKVNRPKRQAKELLVAVSPLNYVTSPEDCIAFVEWCKADPVVAAYQHQLANLGRKPVRGEFEAAGTWIATTAGPTRQDDFEIRALEACASLANPIGAA